MNIVAGEGLSRKKSNSKGPKPKRVRAVRFVSQCDRNSLSLPYTEIRCYDWCGAGLWSRPACCFNFLVDCRFSFWVDLVFVLLTSMNWRFGANRCNYQSSTAQHSEISRPSETVPKTYVIFRIENITAHQNIANHFFWGGGQIPIHFGTYYSV